MMRSMSSINNVVLYYWFMFIISVYFMAFPVFLSFLFVILVGFLLLFLFKSSKVDSIVIILITNIIYWLISGWTSGGMVFENIFSPEFYNDGEGRIFLYYIPLLTLLLTPVSFWRRFQLTRKVSFLLALALFITIHAMVTYSGSSDFSGFLTHHSGAGTFIGALFSYLFFYGINVKSKRMVGLALLLLIPLVFSHSREAWIGCLLVFVWWYVVKKTFSLKKMFIYALFVPISMFLFSFTPAYESKVKPLMSSSVLSIVPKLIQSDDWVPDDGMKYFKEGNNMLMRIRYFVYASKLFASSPFVGVGFARFNDTQAVSLSIPFFAIITKGNRVSNVQHAHNSYLQFLAETGLLGLGLILWLWLAMYKRLEKYKRTFRYDTVLSSNFVAAQAVIVFVFGSALTGHAMAAPSLGFIALVLIGLSLCVGRSELKIARRQVYAEQ